ISQKMADWYFGKTYSSFYFNSRKLKKFLNCRSQPLRWLHFEEVNIKYKQKAGIKRKKYGVEIYGSE
ncbi:hypothetical protein, partial [Mediterraneibacter glycyrrhizinilyticus]|uniref:hypothetical protein n=1 Tax=Mediterraneibacter glycyrrhizinilyticus TaxID=342942 RepID=UPI00195FD220